MSINGPALRAFRNMAGLAVADITAALDCSHTTISKLETGSRERCSPPFLAALCKALGIADRRALMACPYGSEAHEEAAPAHDELADTAPLERPEIGGDVPRIVAARPVGAGRPKVPEVEPRAAVAASVPAPRSGRRSPAKHRAGSR